MLAEAVNKIRRS